MKYKSLLLAACMSFASLISCNGQKGKSNVTLKNQADSVAYGIGVSIGQNMKKDGLDSLNLDLLTNGMKAAMHGDSTSLNAQQAQSVIQAYLGEKQKQKAEAALSVGKKFLEENKKKPGVTELPSGLQYQVMKAGTGPMPKETDTVSVHYHGTLIDGTVFDSSVEKGQPIEWPVNQFVKGWTEALQLMPVGSKWKLWVPSNLGYGDRAQGPKIPANSTLIFEIELLGIKK
jgi:FKBP-type peptidyl-prolyl cis-trans isomerase FklB